MFASTSVIEARIAILGKVESFYLFLGVVVGRTESLRLYEKAGLRLMYLFSDYIIIIADK